MNLQKIFVNNQNWIQRKLDINPNYFTNLKKDQTPKILYIGCSDSRVSAEELMGADPGDIFIHRNIANMVISTDLSAMSVIEYAVKFLHVEHIIVCGHYNCGGVKAALEPKDLGILNPWLRNIRDVYRLHQTELDAIKDTTLKNNRLVELNVQEQCVNVLKTASVQTAVHKNTLTVHGWVFDMGYGRLKDLNINFEKILTHIEQIYKLT